mmetsp:Transcript_12539/g.12331  ORF Transcript_12539/g.12331 Transcript_12539/m.12331 type:complete len:104 (+) Transcript_12539:509-820(+)
MLVLHVLDLLVILFLELLVPFLFSVQVLLELECEHLLLVELHLQVLHALLAVTDLLVQLPHLFLLTQLPLTLGLLGLLLLALHLPQQDVILTLHLLPLLLLLL